MKKNKYKEIRINHFDEVKNAWCIDAWKTSDDNEEGEVIGHIYMDKDDEFGGKSIFLELSYPEDRFNNFVNEEITAFIKDYYKC